MALSEKAPAFKTNRKAFSSKQELFLLPVMGQFSKAQVKEVLGKHWVKSG